MLEKLKKRGPLDLNSRNSLKGVITLLDSGTLSLSVNPTSALVNGFSADHQVGLTCQGIRIARRQGTIHAR